MLTRLFEGQYFGEWMYNCKIWAEWLLNIIWIYNLMRVFCLLGRLWKVQSPIKDITGPKTSYITSVHLSNNVRFKKHGVHISHLNFWIYNTRKNFWIQSFIIMLFLYSGTQPALVNTFTTHVYVIKCVILAFNLFIYLL